MEKKIFQLDLDSSSLKIKEILTTEDFLFVEFWGISNEYPTNNNSHFPLKTMEHNVKHNTFYGKPILGKFNNITKNYEVHNYKEKYDPEFEISYYDYEDGERPLGFVREGHDTVRLEKDENGLTWIVFTAALWVKYNYQGVKKLLKSKRSKISVEVTIIKSHEDENGVEIFDEWVFDGATILGYRPHSRIEAKEGINNAHMTIVEKMKKKSFSQDFKKITFAYENMNDDIKENDSRLYIDKTLQKGESPLTEDVRMNEEFTQEEQVEKVESFTDDVEKVENSEVVENFESDEKIENKKEDESCNNKENESCDNKEQCSEDDIQDDGCGNFENSEEKPVEESNENNCGTFEDDDDDNKDDIDHPDDQDEDSQDSKEENSEKPEEDCGKFEDENPEEKSEEKEVNTDDENQEEVNMSVETFNIDGVEYTGKQLFEKYQDETSSLSMKFESLKKDFDETVEKLHKYEKAEKEAFIEKLCNEVKVFALDVKLNKTSMESVLDKCKKGVITTFEDAKKEVVYEAYISAETDQKVEFSSKADFGHRKNDVDISEKKAKSPFETLTDFINNKN